jgi:hypothetical protein
MNHRLFLAVLGCVSLVAAVVGGIGGFDSLFRYGSLAFVACYAVLFVLSFFGPHQSVDPYDFEPGAPGESAYPPYVAEQELKRQDHGTIPRPKQSE